MTSSAPREQTAGEATNRDSGSQVSDGPTIAFSTLGCKLNQFESDSLATQFRRAGYTIVAPDSDAEIHVINTCTVTNRADRKARNLLYRSRRDHPARLTVLTGCYVDSQLEELKPADNLIVVPNESKQSIVEMVNAHRAGELYESHGSVFDFPVPDRENHIRTMVKVQDGCDNRCAFCIIPLVRGPAQSRPADDVIEAIRQSIDSGAREVVLTGVNMSRYRDGSTRFVDLLERCLDLHGDYRIRVSSVEPDQLPAHFAELFRNPKLCGHLHLCLQSGSQRILKAMRRQYSFDEYVELAEQLRSVDPLFNLTTDVIVGFPGESDDEFAETIDAVRRIGFGHVHTFPYSVRNGTRAAGLPDQLPDCVRTERARLVREAAEVEKRRYRARLVDTTERLLVEHVQPVKESLPDRVRLAGFGQHYVRIDTTLVRETAGEPRAWENQFVDLRITALSAGPDPVLSGEIT